MHTQIHTQAYLLTHESLVLYIKFTESVCVWCRVLHGKVPSILLDIALKFYFNNSIECKMRWEWDWSGAKAKREVKRNEMDREKVT